jgi:hypothetical protein
MVQASVGFHCIRIASEKLVQSSLFKSPILRERNLSMDDYLAVIALQKLQGMTVFDDWLAAPIGTLVQMGVGAGAVDIIGMRTEFPAANRRVAALLAVSGEHAGELIEASHLLGPAVDVSNAVEIVGIDPVPFTLHPPINNGVLIRTREPQPACYVRSATQGSIVQYVCVADGGSHTRGKCLPNINPAEYIGVAKKIGVRLRGQDSAMNLR